MLPSSLDAIFESGLPLAEKRRIASRVATAHALGAKSGEVTKADETGDAITDLELILAEASLAAGRPFKRAYPLQKMFVAGSQKNLARSLKVFAGGRNRRCHPEDLRI